MSDIRYNISDTNVVDIFGARRMRVLLAAKVQVGEVEFPVRLREISCSSALVGAPVIPLVGTPVFLERFPIEVSGRVVWTSEDSFEIEFTEAIVEHELLVAIKKAPIGRPTKPLFPLDHFVGHTLQSQGTVVPISKH
jgi:hypothetical protein